MNSVAFAEISCHNIRNDAEIMRYIHERSDWPTFRFDQNRLAETLVAVRQLQVRLLSQMGELGFSLRAEATVQSLTEEILKSNEIEGERLDKEQVRSSIARRLGVDIGALTPADRHVEGVVDMMLDATQHYEKALTKVRLFDWHAAIFPTGHSGMRITAGGWRKDTSGPMYVVSGPIGREHIHYEAPNAALVDREVRAFLHWFNGKAVIDPLLKAGIAHLWFVTIHPFDDGNGRIARAITDLQLARSEQSAQRFYSMSAQIRKERNAYYAILEATQRGNLDITPWLEWFLACLGRAFEGAGAVLAAVLAKAHFWERHRGLVLNERQRLMLNELLDGFEGKLTSSKWATIAQCSQDTALRDIEGLIGLGLLKRDAGGGRSTSYSLADDIAA